MDALQKHRTFIETKSIEIFEKINSISLTNIEEFTIEIKKLSGLSNIICHVHLDAPKLKTLTTIDNVVIKLFGAGGDLVDRDTELTIMSFLSDIDKGPKIYETDKKSYRVEEFLNNVTTLDLKEKHNPIVIDEMKKAFLFYNSLGDFQSYKDLLNLNLPKKEVFEYLLNKDPKQNIVNFTIKKMRELSKVTLEPFSKKLRESEQFKNDKETLEKLEKIECYLENFEEIIYHIFPEKALIALAHNDAHPLNVLVSNSHRFDKFYVIDHEFCCFNLVGIDMANYNVENLFFYGNPEWPYYTIYESDMNILSEDLYYNRFKDYIDFFAEDRKKEYSDVKDIDEILEFMKSKNYYWRCLALSCSLWFVWSINYFNFEDFASKKSFNYFNFSIDRLMQIYRIAKETIEKDEI